MARTLKELTPDEVNKVINVIEKVWKQISPTIGPTSNLAAIEACLDADRPETFCGEQGKTVQRMLKELSENLIQIIRFFSKRMSLMN